MDGPNKTGATSDAKTIDLPTKFGACIEAGVWHAEILERRWLTRIGGQFPWWSHEAIRGNRRFADEDISDLRLVVWFEGVGEEQT